MAKRLYVFSDGHTELLTNKQSWDGLRDRGASLWVRVGRFSTVLWVEIIDGSDRSVKFGTPTDIAIAEQWKTVNEDTSIGPDSEYWESWKRDRLATLKRTEDTMRLTNHPLLAQVMIDIEIERKHFEQ